MFLIQLITAGGEIDVDVGCAKGHFDIKGGEKADDDQDEDSAAAAGGPTGSAPAAQVINIVEHHRLQKMVALGQKEFKALFITFVKKIKTILTERIATADAASKPALEKRLARLKAHEQEIKTFLGKILANFKDYDLYVFGVFRLFSVLHSFPVIVSCSFFRFFPFSYQGVDLNLEGLIIPATYIGAATAPRFFFLLDGLDIVAA